MKPLKVLVLMHKQLVPPHETSGLNPREAEWKTDPRGTRLSAVTAFPNYTQIPSRVPVDGNRSVACFYGSDYREAGTICIKLDDDIDRVFSMNSTVYEVSGPGTVRHWIDKSTPKLER